MPAAAVAGPLAVGSIAKGVADYQGAKKGRQAVQQAAGEALNVGNEAQTESLARLDPYAATGTNALSQLSALYQPDADYSAFTNSPDYQFAFDQGQRAVNQSLSGRGLSNSGAAMKELQQYGSGVASQNLNNFKNQLMQLVGVGHNATNAQVNVEQQTASNAQNILTNKGQSSATLLGQQYGAIGNTAGSLGDIAGTAYGGGFKTALPGAVNMGSVPQGYSSQYMSTLYR